ncbi:MAG TPA: hypothetical protein DIU10_18315 [Sulfitobacter sp.]|nr:hypothetical protein [Sulfitobacter sp.]
MNIKANFGVSTDRPPANTLRVDKWSDMPKGTAPARYEVVAEDGTAKTFTLAKGNRIILDALIQQPVYCASPVRISDRVCILRRDYGVPITKEMYTNDTATDRAKFGVYFLSGTVRRIDGGEG